MCVLLKRGSGHLAFHFSELGRAFLVLYWHPSYANQGIGLILKETSEREQDLKSNLDFKTMRIYLGPFLLRNKWTTNFKCGQKSIIQNFFVLFFIVGFTPSL